MSKPVPLQDEFLRMVRDKSRDRLAPNECWNLVDYIPNELGAPLRKRGGWSYQGPALTSVNGSAERPYKVAVAPFAAGAQVVAVDDNGRWYDVTSSGVDRGDPGSAPQQFAFFNNLLIAAMEGGNAVKKYGGTSNATDLGGTPPAGGAVTVYKSRLVLGNTTANPNRIWFSAVLNPESWDTSLRWMDTSAPVLGFAPLRSSLLVFHESSVERIRGDIPPGSAAANMLLEPLFGEQGMHLSPNSLTSQDEFAFFANKNGVFKTDGASITDLTRQGGITNYWRGIDIGTTTNISLAAWKGYLWVALTDYPGTFRDFLVFDLDKRGWFKMSNISSFNFAAQHGFESELYFSNRDTARYQVGQLSSVFTPQLTTLKVDGNDGAGGGTAVTPVLETGVFTGNSFSLKRWGDVYLSYDLEDSGGDNPTMTVSYLTDPADTAYTALSPTIPESTTRKRSRLPVNFQSHGVAIKVAQTNASSDTRIYGLELEVEEQEGSNLAS